MNPDTIRKQALEAKNRFNEVWNVIFQKDPAVHRPEPPEIPELAVADLEVQARTFLDEMVHKKAEDDGHLIQLIRTYPSGANFFHEWLAGFDPMEISDADALGVAQVSGLSRYEVLYHLFV